MSVANDTFIQITAADHVTIKDFPIFTNTLFFNICDYIFFTFQIQPSNSCVFYSHDNVRVLG
jgi:hypothetical protein